MTKFINIHSTWNPILNNISKDDLEIKEFIDKLSDNNLHWLNININDIKSIIITDNISLDSNSKRILHNIKENCTLTKLISSNILFLPVLFTNNENNLSNKFFKLLITNLLDILKDKELLIFQIKQSIPIMNTINIDNFIFIKIDENSSENDILLFKFLHNKSIKSL